MSYTREAFVEELSRVLVNLYDPARLRKSWLLDAFQLRGYQTPHFALTELLRKAIALLRPDPSIPLESNAWRVYEILTRRFVEQQKQRQVAAEMGFSTRQMRRHEKQAIRVLADYLWHRYNLEERLAHISNAYAAIPQPEETTPSQEQELAWLQASFPRETADIAQVINPILRHIAPLMQSYHVQVRVDLPETRPPVTVQMTLLRQAMLNFFTAAVHSAPEGQIDITVISRESNIDVQVQTQARRTITTNERSQIREELEMTQRLLHLMNAHLTVKSQHPLVAYVTLPIVKQTTVLVVDDNADTLRLIQRYLNGTRYHFIGASDADQALALAEEHTPRIIVLDVMLPGVDGWELLARLREHPRLQDAAIIVSTILPQEQVALTLGAAAFLRKPLTRQTLLAALDEQMERG